MEIVHLEEKKLRRKNKCQFMTTKRENASIENSLMKKVKIKNEFEEEQQKNKKKQKNLPCSAL